ncbi:MAG: RidA family protein [Planctomycetaceae bacterium]|nr:RidA family protein [Planctomycetaceae bacterium]
MNTVENRLAELQHPLPHPAAPVASYVPAVRVGELVITSGQLPMVGKEIVFTGKVGHDLHEEDAQHAARLCILNALAAIKAEIGDLDRITRVIRVEGYVQSAEGFSKQPNVINGASDLLVQAFGDKGKHSRIAVGVSELPLNAAVEIALWVEVSLE